MSSKESAKEDDGVGGKRHILVVKPLPWRAPKVSRFLKRLDKRAEKLNLNKASNKPCHDLKLKSLLIDQSLWNTPMIFFGFSAT